MCAQRYYVGICLDYIIIIPFPEWIERADANKAGGNVNKKWEENHRQSHSVNKIEVSRSLRLYIVYRIALYIVAK